MNRCILVGRLTRDPEVSFSDKAQMSIARFTVAVDRIPKRDGEAEADFFNCVAFERKAEFVEQYWFSGMRVAVCGRLQNDNYTNKKGEKIYSVSLKADEVEFADGKREADNGQAKNTDVPSNAAPASRTAAPGHQPRPGQRRQPQGREHPGQQ
ncbi:MAG: single-stranded DNA-binding protein [Eubacteriales bacterium]|nr:single-stranded DNA-binding protein [Eubacteriales bacterium]